MEPQDAWRSLERGGGLADAEAARSIVVLVYYIIRIIIVYYSIGLVLYAAIV